MSEHEILQINDLLDSLDELKIDTPARYWIRKMLRERTDLVMFIKNLRAEKEELKRQLIGLSESISKCFRSE